LSCAYEVYWFIFKILCRLGEYQQERKTSLNTKSESGKRELSRLDSKTGLYPDDSKQGGAGAGAGAGGWLSCCLCFSVKN